MAPRSSLAELIVIGGSSKNKKSSSFHSRSRNDGIMVIFGSKAESRPAWTRMVVVVYGSEGGELGFPSAAQ